MDGDVFGGFRSIAVTVQDKFGNDSNMFVFLFESHGRRMKPQRFVALEKRKEKAGVVFWKNKSRGYIMFDAEH